LVDPGPPSGIADDLRTRPLGSVFAMKVFSGGVLFSHGGGMLLFSPFRHRGRISEGSAGPAETPHTGPVVRTERITFHFVLNLRVRSVLIVLTAGALPPSFGSGN